MDMSVKNEEDAIIAQALEILEKRMNLGIKLDSPKAAQDYAALRWGNADREIFSALFLDNSNRLIEASELFHGSIDRVDVYPREIVKAALKANAAGVVLIHNHPTGNTEPSDNDLKMTVAVGRALAIVEVALLDHLVVAGNEALSLMKLVRDKRKELLRDDDGPASIEVITGPEDLEGMPMSAKLAIVKALVDKLGGSKNLLSGVTAAIKPIKPEDLN
jgi:DNA repair protein RadC